MKKPIKKPVKKQTPVKKPTEVVSKKASKPIIPVFFSCDDNYFPILHVALRSLIDKASKDNFYKIHILYDTLAEESIKSLDIFNSENVEIILANVTSFMEERAKKMHAKYYALAIY